jgi:hypothetical protein
LLIVAGALMGAAMGPGAGHASGAVSCSGVPFAQPFLPWLDPASYFLAPDGGFERGGAGWTLTGGAKIARGNETFSVNAAADARSLVLPAGSSATSPFMCVGTLSPTLRIFGFSSTANSALGVQVLAKNALGLLTVLGVGIVYPGQTSWAPTNASLFLQSLGAALTNTTSIAFRFTPLNGSWTIDDAYVDPFLCK